MMTWYDDAMRTIIDLPDEQIRKLAELCKREHISRAEAVRRAIDRLLDEKERERQDRALERSFGGWAGRSARRCREGSREVRPVGEGAFRSG